MSDINWFKKNIAPKLFAKGYDVQYKFFEEGDFGSLNQVIFNSPQKGGGIDFWGNGWLGVEIYDYPKNISLVNVLLDDTQDKEKEDVYKILQQLLEI